MGDSAYKIRDTLVSLTISAAILFIVLFILTNQTTFAVLILSGLAVPITFLIFEYRKTFRTFQCNQCQHNFKVSYFELLFTPKNHPKDSTSTGKVAYKLKCPKCKRKDSLTTSS